MLSALLLSCGGLSLEDYGQVVEDARACVTGDVCVLSPTGKGCACPVAVNQSQQAKVQDAYDKLDWYSTKDNPQPEIQHFGPRERSGYGPWVEAAVRHSAGLAEAPITSTESLRAIETVFACYDSARTGQAVKVG